MNSIVSSIAEEILTGREWGRRSYGDRVFCVFWRDLRTNLPRRRARWYCQLNDGALIPYPTGRWAVKHNPGGSARLVGFDAAIAPDDRLFWSAQWFGGYRLIGWEWERPCVD